MKIYKLIFALGVVIASTTIAAAGSLVYHPVNPTFGGNPFNGSFLLSQAQAQGEGTKSGPQGPDLSGLSNALSGVGSTGSTVVIGGAGQSTIPANP
jgi:curli production assembly/transport component CsgF